MVTAGVYLVARFTPIFTHTAFAFTAGIGALTLLMAGFIALVQTDIKRIIAYSTMSQIGYMFVGVGVGATSAAMFHLMTHAFFKALLFLGAGIVIHALADEQDVRKMGGLKKHMPKTYVLFVIASLALAGIFPLSGFFSKDEILYSAFHKSWAHGFANPNWWGFFHYGVWGLGLVGALLTGIYSFRLIYLVFHGPESELVKAYAAGELSHGHAHEVEHAAAPAAAVKPAKHEPAGGQHASHGEAPATMFWPVALLGVLAALAGLLVVPGGWNAVERFLNLGGEHVSAGQQWLLALLVSLPLGLIGIGIATQIWLRGQWSGLRTKTPALERVFQNAFYWDWLYDRAFARPAQAVASSTGLVEREGVGPLMDLVADTTVTGGRWIGAMQSGLVRFYAFGTVLGVVAAVVIVLWVEG
jgi:NADH-quinone oxidoreductase subunit L